MPVQKTYQQKTEEELDKIEATSDTADDPSVALEPATPPMWRDWVVIGGAAIALAAVCYGISNTALGHWLAEECIGISTLIQKFSAIAGRLMETVPWPSPEHGAESIWETITILFASVLVRLWPSRCSGVLLALVLSTLVCTKTH